MAYNYEYGNVFGESKPYPKEYYGQRAAGISDGDGESFTADDDLTVPGMALELEELMARNDQGFLLMKNAAMAWNGTGDDPMPVLRDLSDIDDVKAEIEDLNSRAADIAENE